MYKQIRTLIKESEGKPFKKDFVYDCYDIMMEHEKGLYEFASRPVFRSNINGLGAYSRSDRKIILDYKKICEDSKDDYSRRMNALLSLRHEIEHAKELQLLYEYKHDIYSVINVLANIDYIVTHGLPFDLMLDGVDFNELVQKIDNGEVYEVDPSERLAYINSFKFMSNLFRYQKDSPELFHTRFNLYMSYIKGYSNNGYYLDPPTYEYLLRLGLYEHFKMLKDLVAESNYSLETRACLGLPITFKEYDEDLLKKSKLDSVLPPIPDINSLILDKK